jgi:hypothetical protein
MIWYSTQVYCYDLRLSLPKDKVSFLCLLTRIPKLNQFSQHIGFDRLKLWRYTKPEIIAFKKENVYFLFDLDIRVEWTEAESFGSMTSNVTTPLFPDCWSSIDQSLLLRRPRYLVERQVSFTDLVKQQINADHKYQRSSPRQYKYITSCVSRKAL